MEIEEMEKALDTVPVKVDRRVKPKPLVSLKEIAKVVTEAFPDGKGWDKTRNKEMKYAKPRKVFCYVARELGWTFMAIAFFVGCKHESVMQQCNSFAAMLDDWEDYQASFGEVFERLEV